MAASGTTKKITSNQILGAGGTATLASATVTGAATVGTTLGVTGVSTFAAGTALLPALTTTGDVNTGIYYPAADTFAVTTGGTERYRVDSSGNLLLGTTSNAPAGTPTQFVNEWSGGAKHGANFNQTVSSATSYTHIAFCTNGTIRGSIDANNATLTYGTVSDYRLKENVQPILNALTRIAALKPSTYKWKDSGTDGEGFIAHELASVVPFAVVGQKDAVNEDGSIKAQQIDLSKVVPILVAAIQELTSRVQTLEAR
jgi:hypothetical protein